MIIINLRKGDTIMGIKKRVVHDAGITHPSKLGKEINDQGGSGFVTPPRSSFAIDESINLVYTQNTKILESYKPNLNIADGDQRPGTASS
jgi:hypothetical protein